MTLPTARIIPFKMPGNFKPAYPEPGEKEKVKQLQKRLAEEVIEAKIIKEMNELGW